jgi:membrane protein YdbS with pleckstrin-like domain
MAPSMEKYLVHSTHDDDQALLSDKALTPSRWQSFMSTAGVVSVITAVIAGVFAGIVVRTFIGASVGVAAAVGIVVFILNVAVMRRYHVRTWTSVEQRLTVLFPSNA